VIALRGYEFTVEDVSGSRITRLRVRRLPVSGQEGEDEGAPQAG
jgi:CBS domain containing-hemolysin-like protein